MKLEQVAWQYRGKGRLWTEFCRADVQDLFFQELS